MSDANTSRLEAALADRYRIARELGAGGMATVYLAEDLRRPQGRHQGGSLPPCTGAGCRGPRST